MQKRNISQPQGEQRTLNRHLADHFPPPYLDHIIQLHDINLWKGRIKKLKPVHRQPGKNP
jgi:hypothetical protein